MFQSIKRHAAGAGFAMLALSAVSTPAFAFPIAAPGTEGFVVIAAGGDVYARYEGNSASFSNNLYLDNGSGQFVFNNHSTPVGTEVFLGTFDAGTELRFRLNVTNTGENFFSGPASRNVDGKAHARVQTDWQPGTTLVSFEDLLGTPEGAGGFNDLSFSFTNTVGGVPEPGSVALLLAGAGVVGWRLRRRATPGATQG